MNFIVTHNLHDRGELLNYEAGKDRGGEEWGGG